MHELHLTKPDGRQMSLYSRRPIDVDLRAPSPQADASGANPHLRWHPLREEWVAYAAHRQARTFLPPADYNPLRPSRPDEPPTELPAGDYDIAVFDNLFPSLAATATAMPAAPVPTRPADGHCEVVVFTPDPDSSLAALSRDHLTLLLGVYAHRTAAIAGRVPQTAFVLPFENRGVEVGVTLNHPHGQIYAYPFVPPVAARMHRAERRHLLRFGLPLLETLISTEIREDVRVLHADPHAVAFVPAWARYPYEVWVAPRRQVSSFGALGSEERDALAHALQIVLRKYDALWARPMPYVMAWYQAPLGAGVEPHAHHLHAEIYPALRMPGRLKYLAGTELAAGMFANDTLPEEKARELRAVTVETD